MSSYNEIFGAFLDSIAEKKGMYSVYAIEEFTLSQEKVCVATSEEMGKCIVLGLRSSTRYCPNIDISFKNLKIILIDEVNKQEIEV